jgi:alpha-galactosidase
VHFYSRHSLAVCASLALTLLCHICPAAKAQATELAATPPMGWNSWNHFAEKITDADVRAAADAMVASGMKDAGYSYVNVDDSWQGERDSQGNIHSNSKFPDMKALGGYVHSKGLRFGIYSSPGPKTCGVMRGAMATSNRTRTPTQAGAWIF